VAAAQADPRVLLLTGDHGYALFDDFRRAAPAQFINAGVAEQNMVGVAAGLAKAGFRPIVYGLSAFVPVRVLEQIKLDVCYEGLPVVFIGDGAGVVYSSLGSSHQCTEDIAALRAVAGIDILSPADDFEMDMAMAHALRSGRPAYVRMGKADLGTLHQHALTAPVGSLLPVRPVGEDRQPLAILATGASVSIALALSDHFDGVAVWSVPSIRPFDTAQLQAIARAVDTLLVLEEHSAAGGLGGLVAELVGELPGDRARVIRLGSEEHFSQLCGSYGYLLQEHALDLPGLVERLRAKGVAA
jgi:transketolase